MTAIKEMPDHARIWVYQADRPFTTEEKQLIHKQFENFTRQWAAHGQKLQATFSIERDQFIVLAVDESYHQASGCSIDASVGVVRQIEQATGLSLLDRSQVAFLDNDRVRTKPFNQIKEAVQQGEIGSQTTIFNNAVQNTREWKEAWTLPAEKSWLKRYFA